MDVVGCDPDGDGGWVWRLENPRLVRPFEVRASASFFYVQDDPVTIPTTEESYRENALPHARGGDAEDIDDVLAACFGDREALLGVFGDDIEEWL